MATLADEELTSIAQEFHDIGAAIGQFRLNQIHDGRELTDREIVQLMGLHISLLNISSSFALQAAQVTLADADQAATTIKAATAKANAAIATAGTIDKVINIGSAATVLAAAVMTGNLDQIASAAVAVGTAVTA
jgi:hypothetical protein